MDSPFLPQHHEYLLERLVHLLFAGHADACRRLCAEARAGGVSPEHLLTELFWPAAECAQQLRHAGMVPQRLFNQACRTLACLASRHAPATPPAAPPALCRSLMTLSASGEPSDLGAHLFSVLAESHGHVVHFAGANLREQEILFALARLEIEVVVIHGSLAACAPGAARLAESLRKAHFWPRLQVAVVGAMIRGGGPQEYPAPGSLLAAADLAAGHPVELLELLALCPEHRAGPAAPGAIEMLPGATSAISGKGVEQFLLRHFPPGRRHWLN